MKTYTIEKKTYSQHNEILGHFDGNSKRDAYHNMKKDFERQNKEVPNITETEIYTYW